MSKYMSLVYTLENEADAVNHDINRPATDMPVAGHAKVALAITGTAGTMKVEPQVSMDGTNWISVGATKLTDGAVQAGATGIVAIGAYQVSVAGFFKFRVFMSAVEGTEITVKATAFPV